MDYYSQLNIKQQIAVRALAIGLDIESTAEKAEVSRATINHWMMSPEFVGAIEELTNKMSDRLYREIINASSLAIKTLVGIINDSTTETREKIQASSKILDLAQKRQDYLLLRKIELLENMYGGLAQELIISEFEDDINAKELTAENN